MAITVYQYPGCSTCRRALAFLDARGTKYNKVDITLSPPTAAQLASARKLADVPLKKLFNVAGESYRSGDFKTRLPAMTDAQALDALTADGKLIKRPLLVGPKLALVGFDEAAWTAALT